MEPTSLATDILAAAMDAVIIMDAVGRVLYWNPAAERLFGIAADQVIGRDLADLLIPPDQRERHRAGLARAAAGRPGAILGRRFEVAGLAPDGTSVPVELTVTRVERLGRTLFVGYLRDITERRRAIAELRDSRRRLVTVSDETRRRLEHDLHDGAQQQLVAAAMSISAAGTVLDQDALAARTLISRAGDQIQEAITGLRELARGLHPDILSRRGLPGAVPDLARRSGIVVDIGDLETGRLPADVEVAAYYVLAESLTNAAKHGARRARIEVVVREAETFGEQRLLVLSVSDDGPGGAEPAGRQPAGWPAPVRRAFHSQAMLLAIGRMTAASFQ